MYSVPVRDHLSRGRSCPPRLSPSDTVSEPFSQESSSTPPLLGRSVSSRDENWTILRTWGPGPSGLLTDPPDLPEPLRFASSEEVNGLEWHERTLWFLNHGPGVVRVCRGVPHSKLVEKEVAHNRVLGTSRINQYHACDLPEAVLEHLDMRTFVKGENYKLRLTNDSVAWVVPAREYEARKRAYAPRQPAGPPKRRAVLEALGVKRRGGAIPNLPSALPEADVYLARIHLPATPAVG